VWYDSTLLVLLENLLIIVPFILVTQASLIDQSWIWGFCIAGIGLAIARVGTLKRFLCELNFPWRLLAAGGILLLANAVLPIIYRELQEERMGKTITWGPAYEMNEWSWLAILPLLVACAQLLPAPRATGPLWPQRRWLPSAVFAAWLLASGVHLYALSYVYTFQMRAALWAPTLVMLAWILQQRAAGFSERQPVALRIVLMLVPFPLALLPLCSKDTGVALALTGLNTVLYCLASRRSEQRTLALQLALASGMVALASLPVTASVSTAVPATPGVGLGGALLAYLFIASLLSRRPELGLVGAVAAGLALGWGMPVIPGVWHYAFQAALIVLLLHSLRWYNDVEAAARALRWATAGLWATHACIWMANGGPVWQVTGMGVGILLIWLVIRGLCGIRPPLAVAVGAGGVALSGPVIQGVGWLKSAPDGPLAVVASFVLLGIGTAVALTKHRWHVVSED